jgi:hypothetical protein
MKPNLFNSIKLQRPKKNVFDLTHDVKLSADMGNLTPILALECVPGDKFELGCESIIRFAPMIAPVMHRMDVTMHYFFVPNRLTWSNWEKFITDANSGLVMPYLPSNVFKPQNAGPTDAGATASLFADYLGVPTPDNAAENVNINALPFAAYQCIYNEYYRDQNLVTPVDYKMADGSQLTSWAKVRELCTLRKRAWEHDYFTASLPFAQKGAAVDIPLGTIDVPWTKVAGKNGAGSPDVVATSGNYDVNGGVPSPLTDGLYVPQITADVEPTTINDLRRAFKLQEWLEKNARGGTRYIENILTHFGVKSSDKRLQRPEYITGVKSPVVISEIVNTTGQTEGLPQGNLAGHGISVSSGRSGSYYCEEHGYIIGIMSVMPKTAYQQGIPKTFLKNDTLDYYWPSFAHIGEQAVENNEIYAYTTTGSDTFGYVPRYAEYKYMPSRVAADFRNSLDYWHLGRKFESQPSLSTSFIECEPTKRIFAVDDPETQSLYCHVLNKIKAIRPMPKFGTPMF